MALRCSYALTTPKSAEGKAKSSQNAYKHGGYTAERLAQYRETMASLKDAVSLLRRLNQGEKF